jgi:uncharacterized protein
MPGIEVETDVAVPMRDGTGLRADIYQPREDGPWPTLLTRTPYGKGVPSELCWTGLDPVAAAQAGFLVIVQDVRGRFGSEGGWSPLADEGRDGFDTVQWAAQLPGSSGRVGFFGGSYCGNTQLQAAIERPPALAAVSPLMTWSEPFDGLFARGGAVELGLAVAWPLLTGFDWVSRQEGGEAELMDRAWAIADEWDQLGDRGYWELPVERIGALARHGMPELGGIGALVNPRIAGPSRIAGRYERIAVPSFHSGGWHDVFVQATLDNYVAMAALGHDARLIVGPWSHARFSDPVGDALYGIRSARDGVPVHPHGDWNDYQLAWFRRQLVPGAEVELPEEPVRIFVMGRNEWRDESAWPLARAGEERWFLHRDRSLSTIPPPATAEPSEFLYDPADPVPTVGGQTVMSPAYPAGPIDQAPVEERADVLVFTSATLQADLEVIGRVRIVLHAESTAPSTDWVGRLCDVGPEGRSLNLCDGILRVEQVAPGCSRYELDLWSTANVFLPGHRLRVQITSSCFPRWDRNLNTARQGESRIETARQRIHHSAERPSFVQLPVVI